ncbi:MAG TPA: PD-(D/E)XK nuclease family protein [Egibacteraceae bacterium]|nr:PD-(D/E)XK nuclease family protein [Egibacteraceae bacterium]
MGDHLDVRQLNPVQRRVLDELLAVRRPRPVGDPTVARRLRADLTARTAGAAALVPPGDRGLYLSKGRLDALGCDGRFVDQREGAFRFSPAVVRGTLAHTGIEIDTAGGRVRPPADVLGQAWERFVAEDRAADYVAGLAPVEADALRADALRTVVEFRDQFPPLPSSWHPRTEPALRARLHDGRLTLLGRPDLMIGRPTLDRRRLLVIDLKTGGRHPARHRADLALYALLATVKYGVSPFQVATYYLDEGDWDAVDVDDDLLASAVADVAVKAERAARLAYARPPDRALRLVAGPACGWCTRAAACPARAAANGAAAAHAA